MFKMSINYKYLFTKYRTKSLIYSKNALKLNASLRDIVIR